jgi:hypothetical protein
MQTERLESGVRRSRAGAALSSGSALAALLLLALLTACGGGGPEELPDRPMSLNIEAMLASQIIEMASAVGGYPVEFTEGALKRAEKRPVSLQLDSVPWNEVLDRVVEEADLEWDWVDRDGKWVIRVRLPEER